MPCHPDRVRRNYHKIVMKEEDEIRTGNRLIMIEVSKLDIATWMTAKEIEHNVWRAIHNGIRLRWVK